MQNLRRVAGLITSLALALPLQAANRKLIGSLLNNVYKNQTVTLRVFYSGSTLQYSSDGRFIKGGKPGPWTLDACLSLKTVKLGRDQLQMAGRRLWFVFSSNKKKLVPALGPHVVIKIEADAATVSIAGLQAAIARVFLSGTDQFVDVAPDYWKPYLRHPEMPPKRLEALFVGNSSRVFKIGKGIARPRPVHSPEPSYSTVARDAGVQGIVTLGVIINTRGRIERIAILQPLGMGLDDSAVRTVRTWRFKAAMRKGTPVRVGVMIQVRYRLYR